MMETMTRHPANRQTEQGMNTQRGGTLLGLIIGTLVGLAAALAVAVYITKVPVPFMNKSQPHSPDQDAAEAKKNRDWDPNAPLYGKNPMKPPAATPAQPDVIPPAPGTAQKPAAANPAATEPAAKSAKPAADPLGDLAKARLGTPEAGSGADPFNYFVQVGAFRTPEDAEQQRAKISLMGLEAKVTEREQSGRTVYRVRLGPFDKKEDADKAKERLDSSGIETALVRVQR
jgi:cell division protein FtsN